MPSSARPAAVVTGGARSIGLSVALELVSQGWRVAAIEQDPRACASARLDPAVEDGNLAVIEASILDRSTVTRELDRFVAAAGPVRALVNNAGKSIRSTFFDQTDAEWDAILDANLKGTFVMSQIVARTMVDLGGGAIVNLGSIAAHGVRTGPPAYAAAKAGLEGLGRLMAVQLGPHGIRVNTVVVGATATPALKASKTQAQLDEMASSTVTGRIGEPEEVARVVAFLCSSESAHVTGQLLSVCGGQWIA
jgi:3-oxoacyl-[acyl-carrier protein] reductase